MENVNLMTDTENISLYHLKKYYEQREIELIAGNKKLLAIIGHDLKNPISSIYNFLNLIRDGVYKWNRKKIEEKLDIAIEAAEKTNFLLESLMEWGLSDNSSHFFQPVYFDFCEVLLEETVNLEIFALQKQININISVNCKETVFADKKMVKCILRNLLTNAIKYSFISGNIDVFAHRKNGSLEITIKDDGIGIEHERVEKIFSSSNPFSTKGTNNESGTGFGLLLCHEFVKINKGDIWIKSALGEGSEFKFTLPVSLQ